MVPQIDMETINMQLSHNMVINMAIHNIEEEAMMIVIQMEVVTMIPNQVNTTIITQVVAVVQILINVEDQMTTMVGVVIPTVLLVAIVKATQTVDLVTTTDRHIVAMNASVVETTTVTDGINTIGMVEMKIEIDQIEEIETGTAEVMAATMMMIEEKGVWTAMTGVEVDVVVRICISILALTRLILANQALHTIGIKEEAEKTDVAATTIEIEEGHIMEVVIKAPPNAMKMLSEPSQSKIPQN